MSALDAHVEDYLRLRRALGFKLERHGLVLPQLVAYLEAAGAATVTSELAIAWAGLPKGARPNHWAARLAVARGFDRSRLVPLHPTTAEALSRYVARRDRLCLRPRSTAFFLSSAGTALQRSAVDKTLRKITTSLGIRTATVRPRAHDLRHSFAVATLTGWLRSGVSVDELMAVLSTYLGHVSPADTYWYLSASPELMTLAAERLDARFGAQPW